MKFSTIFLFAAGSVLAAPLFWGHPNVQVALAPELPFGQVTDIRIDDLLSQNPQDQIWFTGGLVGYFSNEWRAPIWTTPLIDLQVEPDDRGTTPFRPPNTPPSVPPPTLADPPDPERVIINPYIPPPTDPPNHTPPPPNGHPDHPPPGPDGPQPPTPDPPIHTPDPPIHIPDPHGGIEDPPGTTDLPEPNLSAILAALLAVTVAAKRR